MIFLLPTGGAEKAAGPLVRETFSDAYETQLSALNNSRFELTHWQNQPAARIAPGKKDQDPYRNAGIFQRVDVFPARTYRIHAEIFIPEKAEFQTYPRIVIWNKDWETLGEGVLLSDFTRNEWQALDLEFSPSAKDIERIHMGLHSQFAASKGGEFYVKKFEIYETPPAGLKAIALKEERPLLIFDEDLPRDRGLRLEDLNEVAARHRVYITNRIEPSVNRYLHGILPDLKIFLYWNAEILYHPSALMKGVEQHHAEWLVRDSSGRYVEEVKYPGNRIADITNPEYREWITDKIAVQVKGQDFDGIFLDMVCAYYYKGYYSGELISKSNGKIDGAMWREGFIRMIGLLKKKTGKRIVGNGIGLYNGDQYVSAKEKVLALIEDLDGVMIEEFAVTQREGKPVRKKGRSLENDLTMFREIAARGKAVWVSSPAAGGDASEDVRQFYHETFRHLSQSKDDVIHENSFRQ